jgi:DNA mismatch repair protein MutS2
MTLSPTEIEKTEAKNDSSKKKKVSTPDTPTPEARLDLRGVRFEEAMMELERYLDQAFRSRGLREVTIVHGLGTGAIREGTRKLLKKLPYVKEYRDGGVGGGGSGATVVEFDL